MLQISRLIVAVDSNEAMQLAGTKTGQKALSARKYTKDLWGVCLEITDEYLEFLYADRMSYSVYETYRSGKQRIHDTLKKMESKYCK